VNRPYVRRGKVVLGVYQRCTARCGAERCDKHRWQFEVELPTGPDGKRQRVTKGGYATAKEAAEAKADSVARHRAGTLAMDRSKTFGAWLDEWIDAKVERGEIRDSTERGYRDVIRNHLKPRLGESKLAALRGIDLTRAYTKIMSDREAAIAAAQEINCQADAKAKAINATRLAGGGRRMVRPTRVPVPRPISAASIARVHAVVSGALGDAVPDLVARNVAADAKLPKVTRKKVRPPTPEAYGALLDAIEDDRWYPLILCAGFTGLRRGELCGLRWGHIDLETGRMVLGPQRTSVGYRVVEREAKTEAGDERIVWFDPYTLKVIKAWRKQQVAERLKWGSAYHDTGHVFTHEDGRPLHPDYVTKVVKRTLQRHGLPGSKLHDLRHFRASALISTGADIAAVSKAMGHKTIAITSDLYGNLFDKAGREMAERAAAIVPRQRRQQDESKIPNNSPTIGSETINGLAG
jgi:integrase